MKRNLFLVALAGLAFASCSNHDDVFTGKTEQEAAYEYNFVQKFGQPAANHTWGFGNTTKSTRAKWTGTQDNGIGVNTNSNEWYKTMNLPAVITKDEQKKVYKAFKDAKGTNVDINPNWQRFFVQQVWQGQDTYTAEPDRNGHAATGIQGNQINQLLCGKSYESMGHINNGNDATISTTNVYVAENTPRQINPKTELPDGIMLVTNGGTACFGYHASYGEGFYSDKYLMLEIDGAYYVGFDFEFEKESDGSKFKGDDVYTDWIVKIVPADYTANADGKRVFCEDLGTSDDFDFNDIVLDVVQGANDNWSNTIVTLRAAGGTLPAYIYAGEQQLGEVHELFGVPAGTMVNTRANGAVERPVVVLEVSGNYSADDINIVVEGQNGIKYTLTAEKGKVPYKFATDLGVEWADERQDINDKWGEKFNAWVADESKPFWK